MPNNLELLADIVLRKLRDVDGCPRRSVVRALLETAYFATLREEEGKFIRGTLTFSNPDNPQSYPPLRRIYYPEFTPFQRRIPLTVSALVKLSRAVDGWSSSIAVFGTSAASIYSWGVLDQLVHRSVRLHHEGHGGFRGLGVLSIHMEGVGALSVYHGDLLLGGLRQDRLVHREVPALTSYGLFSRLSPVLEPVGERIAITLGENDHRDRYVKRLFDMWSATVARICIGLRRLNTGGALLFTDFALPQVLEISNAFRYDRLSEAALLTVLDEAYRYSVGGRMRETKLVIPKDLATEEDWAEADVQDRQRELTGAVRLVTSLAAVDGAVVLTPLLGVRGFGVKVIAAGTAATVYDGQQFEKRGTNAKLIDTHRFGTRHAAAFRFCRSDPSGFAIVVSQDGNVRLVMRLGRSVAMWDDVRLVRYDANASQYLREEKRFNERRAKWGFPTMQGYSPMPKSLAALMSATKRQVR